MNPRTSAMSIVLTLALALSATMVPTEAAPPSKVTVSNSNDSGAGSFRAAIEKANMDPAITRIQFLASVSTITLQQTVLFMGEQDLTIDGNRATLDGKNVLVAFLATGGGDLAVHNLTVRNALGEGIAVEVPGSATGTIRVSLSNVNIIDNKGHGVLVNDQEDPIDPLNPNGSDASVDVSVIASQFIGNGFSVSDRDGLRVNEGGVGHLIITVKLSRFQGNGADGIEVDERGAGDVRVDMFGSAVTENGPFDNADLDDGFDIDEAGTGDVRGRIVLSSANNNFEEGFDFNEMNAGDLRVDMLLVEASGNGEEGIDYEEDDDELASSAGNLVTTMELIKANDNKGGNAGLKIRERGGFGDLNVTLKGVETSNNLTGGILIQEDAAGNLVSSITRATALANTGRGIDIDENGDGTLTAAVSRSNSSNNGGIGLRADEAGTGAGTLDLSQVTASGNIGGDVVASADVIVTSVP